MSERMNFFARVFFSLITGYMYLVFAVTSIVFFPLSLLIRYTSWFDPRLRVLHQFSCFWASIYTWVCPLWQVRVRGRRHIRNDRAYVVVCNHQSMIDIMVIFRLFRHFKWVSKSELFSVPVIGWNMTLNRYIRINRSSVRSQRKMLQQCVETVKQGSSVMIFPEGTRSVTGELRPFKEGAFHVARESGADIIPMVISGSSKALPNKGIIFRHFAKITLEVLPPIPFASVEHLSQQELSDYVRDIILRRLCEMAPNGTPAPQMPPSC